MPAHTAIAHPNIAFIKYWGNRDEALRLPANGSISMNLAGLETRTTVTIWQRSQQPPDSLSQICTRPSPIAVIILLLSGKNNQTALISLLIRPQCRNLFTDYPDPSQACKLIK
jgi:hypothetical protein